MSHAATCRGVEQSVVAQTGWKVKGALSYFNYHLQEFLQAARPGVGAWGLKQPQRSKVGTSSAASAKCFETFDQEAVKAPNPLSCHLNAWSPVKVR